MCAAARETRLLFDAHLIADTANPLNATGNVDGALHLGLVVDKAAEQHFVVTRDDSDVKALDTGIPQQRRLDLAGDDAGIHFLAANVLKVPQGGWVPLVMGLALMAMMTSWKRGRELLLDRWKQDSLPLSSFLARLPQSRTVRVPSVK